MSQDVSFYKIKINTDSYQYVSGDTSSYSFEPTEGNNLFRISASDNYGNESNYAEFSVVVDYTSPNKPTINSYFPTCEYKYIIVYMDRCD